MFPFDLAGPPFLVFYAVFGAVVLITFWSYAARLGPAGSTPALSELTADPYQIAYLRGGSDETVKLAIVNLVDRGLLTIYGKSLRVSGKADEEALRRPLDRAILARCVSLTAPADLFLDSRVRTACDDYGRDLRDRGLLRSDEEQQQALTGAVVAVGLLGGITVARIFQAFSHGRYNILFLLALTLVACLTARRIYAANRTPLGRRAFSSLKILLSRLKSRADRLAAGGATNEAVLFASVFGIYALPLRAFPFVNVLFPKPQASDSGGGDSGSDSGGGGGCGGGCGGCGGG